MEDHTDGSMAIHKSTISKADTTKQQSDSAPAFQRHTQDSSTPITPFFPLSTHESTTLRLPRHRPTSFGSPLRRACFTEGPSFHRVPSLFARPEDGKIAQQPLSGGTILIPVR